MSVMLSAHIVFLLMWSAGLLYFPQLLVRQAVHEERETQQCAIHMQRILYAYVMTPSALLAVLAGIWLIFERGFNGGWLHIKLTLVLLMVFFHVYCGVLMAEFRHERIQRHLLLYRALPVIPALLITAVVTLVTGKPF